MKLEDIPTKELLALHNRIADKPAGPKTFATRTKLVVRIKQIAADKNIDLTSFGQPKKPKATAQRAEPKAEATEKKPRDLGVGSLARAILMDPAGYPHALVANMANAQTFVSKCERGERRIDAVELVEFAEAMASPRKSCWAST